MTLAWPLFAFVGLFTARYMRQVWEPRKLLGEKAWFTVGNVNLHDIKIKFSVNCAILILNIFCNANFKHGVEWVRLKLILPKFGNF